MKDARSRERDYSDPLEINRATRGYLRVVGLQLMWTVSLFSAHLLDDAIG